MRLSDTQIQEYDREGWLFLPEVFGADEAALMADEAHRIYATDRQEVFREKDGKTARTAFAAHTYNEVFRRLAHHPRLIGPIEQVLGDRLYVHQFKLNAKAAFDGDQWQWHQDFGTWHRDDGMPEARAMNIAVFLDPVTEFNGPLMFIPQSHKKGVLAAGHDTGTTSYPLWTLDHATVRQLADQFGLVAPKGPAGSVLMFHGCLAHASPGNISPYDRTIASIRAASEPRVRLPPAPGGCVTRHVRESVARTDVVVLRAIRQGGAMVLAAKHAWGSSTALMIGELYEALRLAHVRDYKAHARCRPSACALDGHRRRILQSRHLVRKSIPPTAASMMVDEVRRRERAAPSHETDHAPGRP
jgi:ectoine hydroxylase